MAMTEKYGRLNEKQLEAIQALADSPGYWHELDGPPKLLMIRLLSHIAVQQQELAELRTRLAEAEAERDRYRAALESLKHFESHAWEEAIYEALTALEGGDE